MTKYFYFAVSFHILTVFHQEVVMVIRCGSFEELKTGIDLIGVRKTSLNSEFKVLVISTY